MQTKSLLKSLLIAFPLLALSACSTTSSEQSGQADNPASNDTQQQEETVVTSPAEPVKTPEEKQMERYADLRTQKIIYFNFDDADIRPEFAELLKAHADYLVKNPGVNVRIEGHTDERGTPEYNIALGERRANAVKQYLMNLGVPASQMSTVSYGEEMPLDTGHNEEAWAKNRRAVLVY